MFISMARYGVNVLLTKYNNPTLFSARILINNKSYYHPYKIYYRTEYDTRIANSTMIGDSTLETSRSLWYLCFAYKTKAYNITFTRGNRDIFSFKVQPADFNKWKHNIYAYRPAGATNFQIDYNAPYEFEMLVNTMTGATLAEIYQKYLPILIKMM